MSQDRRFFKSKAEPESPPQSQVIIQPIEVVHHKFISENDMIEAYNEILLKRNNAIHEIEKDVSAIKEMFKDVNDLMKDQQPSLNNISKDISDTKNIAKNVEKNLEEAEEKQKRWCIIC